MKLFENAVKSAIENINETEIIKSFKLYEIYNGKDGGTYRASRYLARAITSERFFKWQSTIC